MRNRWILPLLLFIGIALRLYYFLAIRDTPEFQVPLLDVQWYHERALSFAAGEGPATNDVFRPPFYTFFLGTIYRAGLAWPAGPRLVQFLIGLGTVALVGGVARVVFDRATGYAAAALALFYYPFVFFEGEVLVTSLFLFILMGGLLLAARAPGGPPWLWPASGFVFGLAAITRPTIVPFFPLLLVWQWRHGPHGPHGPPGRRVAHILLLAAALAVLPAAAMIRAHAISGEWIPIASQGGVNFFIGNNGLADGKTATVPGWVDVQYETKQYEDNVGLAAKAIAERETGRSLGPGAVSSYWRGKALRWMAEHPGRAAGLMLRKAYYLVNQREIPNNRLIGAYVREAAPLLFFLSVGIGILFPLGVAGVFVRGGSRAGRELLLCYFFVEAALVVAFFICSRFRIPVVPVWIIFAAHLLVELFRRRAAFPWARSLAIAVPLAALSLSRFFDVSEVRDLASIDFARAWAFSQTGRTVEAEREYRKVIELEPRNPRPKINLGGILARTGRFDEAERLLIGAYDNDPSYGSFVWNNVAGIRMMCGDLAGARESLERAIDADPDDADVYTNLANVLRALGDAEGAMAMYDEAIRRGTTFGAVARLGRLRAVADAGRLAEATDGARAWCGEHPDDPMGWALLHHLALRAEDDGVAGEAEERFRSLVGRQPFPQDLPGYVGGGR